MSRLLKGKVIARDTPAGTPVILQDDRGDFMETVTRSEPWQLGHGAWVVLVDGKAGGYLLSRIYYRDNPPKGGSLTK